MLSSKRSKTRLVANVPGPELNFGDLDAEAEVLAS